MSVSIFGLGAILIASEQAFLLIKIAGAMYLIYLGLSCWNEASFQISNDTKVEKGGNYSSSALLSKGFMVGISNPKDLLFFAALFPSFIDTQSPHFEQYVILAATWFIIDFIAMFMYASVGTKIGPWFSKPMNIKLFNRVTGSFYISLGSTLAVSSAFNEKT
jgi:homoserine/homoserine lactone efflux protein